MKGTFFVRRNVCVILLFLLITQHSFSQNNFRVTGKVTDVSGKSVPGATVKVKGTDLATATDADGSYSLTAPSGTSILVITSVGFIEQEIAIDNRSEVNISLAFSTSSLEDVVVIGYGTAKRKDVTGSVAGINQKDIRSRPVDNALQAMQGKVAGVDITSNERPGQVGSINIRGVRSLTASNLPLFVVDGIPLTTGGIEYLNPNDIESIDVLKDASATAIFGSRGANGVVIVTTKQGKAGKAQVNLYNSVTFETIRDWAPMMTAAEYIEFRRWAVYYSNPATRPRGDQPTIANDKDIFLATADPSGWANIEKGWAGGTWDGSKVGNTDWTGMVSQTGITTDNTISVSGGSDKIKAYASFGYLNNKGTSIGQKYTRFSGKASVDIKATNWFNMGLTVNLTHSTQEFGQSQTVIGSFVGSPAASIYESARRLFKHAVPFDSAGNKVIYPGGDVATKTIVDEWKLTQDQRVILRAFGSLYAQLDFGNIHPALKGLKYRFNFGPDFSTYTNGIYIDGQSTASSGISGASLQEAKTRSWTLDNLVYYDKELGRHSFGLTLLQSATKFVADPINTIRGTGIPFASQKWNALNSAVIPAGNLSIIQNSDLIKRQLVSYMARLNYAFDDKYLMTVSVRSDGASQLYDDGSKFALFPSAALAWRISRENFMQNLGWLNDLKLRAGVGVTGNSAISAYATKGRTIPLFYPFVTSVTAASLPGDTLANTALEWEKTTQYNLGLDFTIFQRRISGSIDVYTSQTRDLLMARTIPTVTGFRATYQNIGQTANRGIEININTLNIATKSFQWSTNLNASWQKDRIVSLSNGKQDDIVNNWFIDQPLGVIYGFEASGVWQFADTAMLKKFAANGNNFTAGNVRPVDQNGDDKIDANNDRTIIGHTRPRWVVGMTNSFAYKGFELSFFIYGRLNYWFNTGGEAQTARGNQRQINYWTDNNQNSEYQKPIYSVASGDSYSPSLGYKKASFLKLRNISASYTFSENLLKAVHMSGLRVYFQATNPGMLFSKIRFMDMDNESIISNRGFTFGINAGF
jgi:TonB-dependent starch-binding outer membrane protein SusC